MKILTFLIIVFTFVTIRAQETQRYINVAGISEITLPADQVNFDVQIKTINESLERSRADNFRDLKELMVILSRIGIDSNYIEISPVSIGKNYVYEDNSRGSRTQDGFYTSRRVKFLLKDLLKYYDLINTLSSNSSYEFYSHYGISNYEEIHEKAYVNALKAAKEKADYLVESLGLKLGKVLEIDEFTTGQQFPYPYNVSEAKIAAPENYGKVLIKRKIRAKFEIKD